MSPSPPRRALVALLLLPPILLAAALVLRARSGRESRGPAETAVPTARWPEGQPKIAARDWSEGAATFQELCALARDGAVIGCGVLRDGQPWDGVLVTFSGSQPDAALSEIRRFEHGKRHGLWQTFQPGGAVGVELQYEADRLVSKKVRDPDGELRPARDPAPRLPPGAIPTQFTPPERR